MQATGTGAEVTINEHKVGNPNGEEDVVLSKLLCDNTGTCQWKANAIESQGQQVWGRIGTPRREMGASQSRPNWPTKAQCETIVRGGALRKGKGDPRGRVGVVMRSGWQRDVFSARVRDVDPLAQVYFGRQGPVGVQAEGCQGRD